VVKTHKIIENVSENTTVHLTDDRISDNKIQFDVHDKLYEQNKN